MKHKSSQSFLIDINLYGHTILFSINQTNKEFDEFLLKSLYKKTYNKIRECSYGIGMFTQKIMGQCYWNHTTRIIVIRILDRWEIHNTIAHEIMHGVDFILRDSCKLSRNSNTDEAYAYLTGYIHGEFYKKFKNIEK